MASLSSSAFRISDSIQKPNRKPLQPKNLHVNLAGGGALIIPKKPNPLIPHPAVNCAGKENREISNFLKGIKVFRVEEAIQAERQRTERIQSDGERALTAFGEMNAMFQSWTKDTERRWAELEEANVEIRRIARTKEHRASYKRSSPFVSLRAREDDKRRQLAQLQEEVVQKEFVQEELLQKGFLRERFLQEGPLSELSTVKSCDLLNNFKWTSNRRRRRQLEMLMASRGNAEMENAIVAKVGCAGSWRWRWPKIGKGNSIGVWRQKCCLLVPDCL